MGNTLNEDAFIRHMDVRRIPSSSDDASPRLAILIEHGDGTDYTMSVADRGGTPEHSVELLAAVMRGANIMFRALDALRALGYVDVRPVGLLGREIVFGLNRVTLEVEILQNRDGEIECDISVASVDQRIAEEVECVLEENSIDVI